MYTRTKCTNHGHLLSESACPECKGNRDRDNTQHLIALFSGVASASAAFLLSNGSFTAGLLGMAAGMVVGTIVAVCIEHERVKRVRVPVPAGDKHLEKKLGS